MSEGHNRNSELGFATRAIHAASAGGHDPRPVAPSPILSTTFERGADGTYPGGFSYGRRGNPNRQEFEQTLASLEGGFEAAAFASGSAAAAALFQSLAPGDHVVAPRDAYYGTIVILKEIFARWGLNASFVDMTDLSAVSAAITPATKMLWIETPSNPLMKVTDIQKIVDLGRKNRSVVVCDNTVATPYLQSPFKFGCDFVLHSVTKYIGGHSDVLCGGVVAREASDLWQRLRAVQMHYGAIPSPFDCWLVQRGAKTLAIRMAAHCAAAQKVAEALKSHPKVSRVNYAGLSDHPGHALAKAQMRGFGGLMSFEVKGGEQEAFAVAGAVKLITRATSLGGVETLIEHRASMEGPGTTTPSNLLRLSVGLEDTDDLIADLRQALTRLT